MKYTFLTSQFYTDYPNSKYPQIEVKDDRPYAHIVVNTYGKLFCVPLRSKITHPHAYFTNKKTRSGIDYSKAVVIDDINYIDNSTKVFLRQDEFDKLRGKDYVIQKQFEDYIELYKKAKIDETIPYRDMILNFSTLQYFEKYIYPKTDNIKDATI